MDACGSEHVLVVFVIPDLPDGDAGHLRLILVPDGISMDFSHIPANRIFLHCVGDRVTVHKLGQLTECMFPSVRRGQFCAPDFLAARVQMNRDALRPVSVLVVIVIPDLHDLDVGGHDLLFRFFFRNLNIKLLLNHQFACFLGVGDHKSGGGIARDLCHIAFRNLCFGHRVLDLTDHSVIAYIPAQVVPAELPAVTGIPFHSVSQSLAVSIELDFDIRRMFTAVHPDLLHFNLGLFGFMCIGQCSQRSAGRCTRQGISNHIRLLPGVYDFRAVLALRQLINPSDPVVFRIQVHRLSCRFAVRQKLNSQTSRPQSVTVVLILPELLHCYGNLSGIIVVDQCVDAILIRSICHEFCLSFGHRDDHNNLFFGILHVKRFARHFRNLIGVFAALIIRDLTELAGTCDLTLLQAYDDFIGVRHRSAIHRRQFEDVITVRSQVCFRTFHLLGDLDFVCTGLALIGIPKFNYYNIICNNCITSFARFTSGCQVEAANFFATFSECNYCMNWHIFDHPFKTCIDTVAGIRIQRGELLLIVVVGNHEASRQLCDAIKDLSNLDRTKS